MTTALRNLLAIVLGFFVGSAINMALITIGPMIIPPPDGMTEAVDMETLAASMHLFRPQHFIFPFLAHALGTFVGAFCAYFIAVSRKARMSYIVGSLFLFGGLWVATQLPSPMWFDALDLSLAYLPRAALAGMAARKVTN